MRAKKLMTAIAMMAATASMTVPVFASTVYTSEFGSFNYDLSKSGNIVEATTSCSRTVQKLITTLVVQLNATGETIITATDTKYDSKRSDIIRATNTGKKQLAAFSSHTAIGKTSIAEYKARTF